MKNAMFIFALLFLLVIVVFSCDDSNDNELINTMWVYSNPDPQEMEYFEFSKDTLFMWSYNFIDTCCSISSRFRYKVDNNWIIVRSSDSIWVEMTRYDIAGDTLKLLDICKMYSPDYIRMIKYEKPKLSWKICY